MIENMDEKMNVNSKDISLKEKILSAISYIPVVNIYVIRYRRNQYIWLNFNQAITLIITEVLLLILCDISFIYLNIPKEFLLIPVIIVIPFNIIAIIFSLSGKYFKVPIIGWDRKIFEDSLNFKI